jgi:hypothetical protein
MPAGSAGSAPDGAGTAGRPRRGPGRTGRHTARPSCSGPEGPHCPGSSPPREVSDRRSARFRHRWGSSRRCGADRTRRWGVGRPPTRRGLHRAGRPRWAAGGRQRAGRRAEAPAVPRAGRREARRTTSVAPGRRGLAVRRWRYRREGETGLGNSGRAQAHDRAMPPALVPGGGAGTIPRASPRPDRSARPAHRR